MFKNFSSNLQGIIFGLLSFAAFAVSDATSKLLTAEYSTFQIIGWNNVFGLIAIAVFSLFMGGPVRVFRTSVLKTHIGRAVCNVAISLMIVVAFAHLPLATIYTLLFVSPFISTLLAIPIFKEKVNVSGWISIVLGFLGVLIVLRPGFGVVDLWLFLPLAITLFIAGLWLLSRSLPAGEHPLTLAIYPVLLNIAVGLPFTLILDDVPAVQDLWLFALCGSMIVCGLISGATAFRLAKTSVVSPLHYTQMLWGIMFGYVLFGDVPDLWTLVGAVFIIGSGIYLIVAEGKAQRLEIDHI